MSNFDSMNKNPFYWKVFFDAVIIALIFGLIFLTLHSIGTKVKPLPPVNSTEEWKEILEDDNPCKWYQFGCQRLECVIDCNEINKEAGEIICVC